MKFFKSMTIGLCKYGSIKYIMILRLAFGLYFQISNSRIVNFIVGFLCYSCHLLCLYKFITEPPVPLELLVVAALEYTVNVCLARRSNDCFAKYCTVVSVIDAFMGFNLSISSVFAYLLFFFFTFIHVSRQIALIFFGSYLENTSSPTTLSGFLYSMALTANSMSHVPSVALFDLFRVRLRLLSSEIKQLLLADMSRQDKMRKIKKILFTYKNLMDNLENNIHTPHILLHILCRFVLIFCFVFNLIKALAVGTVITVPSIIGFIPPLIQNSVIVLMIPMVAELVLHEFSELNKLVADLTFGSQDECQELARELLEYLETRPPRFSMLRLLPIDMSLLLSFVSLCTTLVIGVFQLYG